MNRIVQQSAAVGGRRGRAACERCGGDPHDHGDRAGRSGRQLSKCAMPPCRASMRQGGRPADRLSRMSPCRSMRSTNTAPGAGHHAGARDDRELPGPRRRRAGPRRPFLDLQKPAEVSRLWSIAEKVHALALELGGRSAASMARGWRGRRGWRGIGPLYPVFRQVKAIFDPKNMFNPGKIVDPDPR